MRFSEWLYDIGAVVRRWTCYPAAQNYGKTPCHSSVVPYELARAKGEFAESRIDLMIRGSWLSEWRGSVMLGCRRWSL